MVIPDQWATYARQQDALSRSTSLTDRCWGLESALDEQLDAAANGVVTSPEEAKRHVATAARRIRHRARLLTIYGPGLEGERLRTDSAAEARVTLRALARTAGSFDFLLLVTVARGIKPDTIAERLFMSSAAVRQRVSRARRAHLHLLG